MMERKPRILPFGGLKPYRAPSHPKTAAGTIVRSLFLLLSERFHRSVEWILRGEGNSPNCGKSEVISLRRSLPNALGQNPRSTYSICLQARLWTSSSGRTKPTNAYEDHYPRPSHLDLRGLKGVVGRQSPVRTERRGSLWLLGTLQSIAKNLCRYPQVEPIALLLVDHSSV